MRTVLGLSLNSHDVAWVLLDGADCTVVDNDVMEMHADLEIAGTAARSAHAIARACGFEVDRVRLTWTDDAACNGMRLRTRLRSLGFAEVEVVPLARATAVIVDPEATAITPRLGLAYGAALAAVGPSEPSTVLSVVQPGRSNSRAPRRRFVPAVLGVAAAAVLGLLLCLSAGAAPQTELPVVTTAVGSPADGGWATVSSPSDNAAIVVRKVVAAAAPIAPAATDAAPTDAAPTYAAPTYAAPTDAPVPVAAEITPEPTSAPTEVPHLTDALPLAGPVSGLADPGLAAPEPDIAQVMDALSALP